MMACVVADSVAHLGQRATVVQVKLRQAAALHQNILQAGAAAEVEEVQGWASTWWRHHQLV